MHAFTPRRSTEPQISGAITLGWRIAFTSIGLTVRKSLDARAELLWNTALVEVISAKTLRVEDVLEAAPPHRRPLAMAVHRRRSHGEASAGLAGFARRARPEPRRGRLTRAGARQSEKQRFYSSRVA